MIPSHHGEMTYENTYITWSTWFLHYGTNKVLIVSQGIEQMFLQMSYIFLFLFAITTVRFIVFTCGSICN